MNVLLSRGILHEPHIYQKLSAYIKPDMKVTVVLYAFFKDFYPNEQTYDQYYGNDNTYQIKMIETFKPYGISKNQISFIDYYKDDNKTAKEKIEQADILYFPGGAPDQMMKRLEEKSIIDAIINHQGICIGSSAGAMIQLGLYHISPDNEYHKFEIKEGLNLIKSFFIEVHYRRRKKQKSSLRKVHRQFKMPIYAIPDDGCLIFNQNEITLLGTARQLYHQKGILSK